MGRLVEQGGLSTTLTGLASAPESNAGKIFTVFLLFGGVGVFLYLAGVIVDVITRGVVSEALNEPRRKKVIEELRDHVIICGYRRVGRGRCGVHRHQVPDVVVDINPEPVETAQSEGLLVVLGDGPRMRISSGRDRVSGASSLPSTPTRRISTSRFRRAPSA